MKNRLDVMAAEGSSGAMRHLILIAALAAPTLASGQDDGAGQVLPRQFVCSMLDSSMGQGGEWVSRYDADEDGRPSLVHVPADGDVVQDSFSEDGRYYRYLRLSRDESGSFEASMFGTFDLQERQLTVSRAFFDTGNDAVQRSFAVTSRWACVEFDELR